MYKGILIPHHHSVTVGCKKCACITYKARSILFCKDDAVCAKRQLKVVIQHVNTNSSAVVEGKEISGDAKEKKAKSKTDGNEKPQSEVQEDKSKSKNTSPDRKTDDKKDKTSGKTEVEKSKSAKNESKTSHKKSNEIKDKDSTGANVQGKANKTSSAENKKTFSKKYSKDNKKSLKDDKTSSKDIKKSLKDEHKSSKNDKKSSKDNKKDSKIDKKSSKDDKKASKDNKKTIKDNEKDSKNNKNSSIDDKTEKNGKTSSKDDKKASKDNKKTLKDNEKDSKNDKTTSKESSIDDKESSKDNKKSLKDDKKSSLDKVHVSKDGERTSADTVPASKKEKNSSAGSASGKSNDTQKGSQVTKEGHTFKSKTNNFSPKNSDPSDKKENITEEKSDSSKDKPDSFKKKDESLKEPKDEKDSSNEKEPKSDDDFFEDDVESEDSGGITSNGSKSEEDVQVKPGQGNKKKPNPTEKEALNTKGGDVTENSSKSNDDDFMTDAKNTKQPPAKKGHSNLVKNIVDKAKISMGKTKDKSPCLKSLNASRISRMCHYKKQSYKNGEIMKLKNCISCSCNVVKKVVFKCTQDKACLQKKSRPNHNTVVDEEKCYFRSRVYSIGKGFFIENRKCTCTRNTTGLIFRCVTAQLKPKVRKDKDRAVNNDKQKGSRKKGNDSDKNKTVKEKRKGVNNKIGNAEENVSNRKSDEAKDESTNVNAINTLLKDIARDKTVMRKFPKKENKERKTSAKKNTIESKHTTDSKKQNHLNLTATRIVFNIQRSTKGCSMGNSFIKFHQAIERPCSRCLCTKNPDHVFFCKTRKSQICVNRKAKCLFEKKAYDIADSISKGCNRCICDFDQNFNPVVKCFKDPFCVEEGREFCWRNGKKIPLGLVYRDGKCKECACLLYRGSPTMKCEENQACRHLNKKELPQATNSGNTLHHIARNHMKHNHMTVIKTKYCSVDGKVIPLLEGITVGNCKTCVCFSVGYNVGFYCKKISGCIDVFNRQSKKSAKISNNRNNDHSLDSKPGPNIQRRNNCQINTKKIPVGSKIRIEECTACQCKTDSQDNAYLACRYHPSCAKQRSIPAPTYSHHALIHKTHHHNMLQHTRHVQHHHTEVINGCRRRGKVIRFGSDLALSKCKVCTCKQLPSGPVFICENTCKTRVKQNTYKNSPMISPASSAAKQDKPQTLPTHAINYKVTAPTKTKPKRRPACVYQGKSTPLGKSRTIPGGLVCSCIKQSSGSLVFSCTRGEAKEDGEERRRKKEQLIRFLNHETVSAREDTKQFRESREEEEEELERRRRKKRQTLELLRHQSKSRNRTDKILRSKKQRVRSVKPSVRSSVVPPTTGKHVQQWSGNHQRSVPKQGNVHGASEVNKQYESK